MQPVYMMAASNGSPTQAALPRVENVSCVLPATDNHGGLYIGNYFGAVNTDVLKEYGIRAVLTTSIETPVAYAAEEIPFHKKIDAHDKENFSIMEHLEECLEFIEKHRQVTNVFVHCYAGMSRSATVVLAYLMKNHHWPYEAALSFLRWKRSIVNPNEGFAAQLKHFERMLGIVPKGLHQVIKDHMLQQNPRLANSMVVASNSIQNTGGELQQMTASSPINQPQGQYGQQKRAGLQIPQPVSTYPSPEPSPRVSSVSPNKLGLGQGRPPSQVPRTPSTKALPLYERSPNKTLVQPAQPLRPQQRTQHQETPIPNFLQKKNSTKSQTAKGDPDPRLQASSQKQFDSKDMRTSKVAIRPRDLPGYRMN